MGCLGSSQAFVEDESSATSVAMKFLLSLAMTDRYTGGRRSVVKILILDVSRAHFPSPTQRELYIDLPAEDHEEGMVGLLLKMLYGTRDAAQNWEFEYIDFQHLIISAPVVIKPFPAFLTLNLISPSLAYRATVCRSTCNALAACPWLYKPSGSTSGLVIII